MREGEVSEFCARCHHTVAVHTENPAVMGGFACRAQGCDCVGLQRDAPTTPGIRDWRIYELGAPVGICRCGHTWRDHIEDTGYERPCYAKLPNADYCGCLDYEAAGQKAEA
jgi:hypothetical protein